MEATETQQSAMKKPEPQKEHLWLKKLVGEWTVEGEAQMGPGKPTEKFSGTERVRSIGDVWFLAEGTGEMPGGGASTSIMTLGYDPQKKRFVGTFIGSMMTNLWLYDGALDAAGKTLTLDADGPSMTGDGKTAHYKDAITFEGDDRRIMTSHVQGADGKWTQIMKMTSRRTK
ncbi:MAG TPA: DUF1579 domain-containing protein [Thermoanaerobaculia bacterium]|nr:DUF1579 domain-containing protein [Thermoanaerobaculia bacterium]